jgi:hypothetical protein
MEETKKCHRVIRLLLKMRLAGFLCFKLTLNPLRFTSHQRNRYKKTWAILKNINFWMIKLTKTPILQNAEELFFNCKSYSLKNLSFCKSSQLFFVPIWEDCKKIEPPSILKPSYGPGLESPREQRADERSLHSLWWFFFPFWARFHNVCQVWKFKLDTLQIISLQKLQSLAVSQIQLTSPALLKSDNLQYNMHICWVDGSMEGLSHWPSVWGPKFGLIYTRHYNPLLIRNHSW